MGRRSRATKRRPTATGGGGCMKAIQSRQMFGFNITPEAIMSCWELDKNTFIICNLYNMNTKGVLNILHMRMTCPILDGNISDFLWTYRPMQRTNLFIVYGVDLKYTEKHANFHDD